MDAVNSGGKDNSVVIRGVTIKAGIFSDLELGPLYEFSQLIESGQGFKNLSALMPELYASLRAIFGESITQFWQAETHRLTLHTGEIMMLANLAAEALSTNADYQASNQRVLEMGMAKQEPVPLAPAPAAQAAIVRGPNPQEEDIAARLAVLQQEVMRMQAQNKPATAQTPG